MSLWKREASCLSVDIDVARFFPKVGLGTYKEHIELHADFVKSPLTALEHLAEGMGQSKEKKRPLDIILSDRLVRYLIIPSMQGLRSAKELQLAAEARYEQVFGNKPADWCVITDMETNSERHLSCALERQLLEALLQQLRNAGYKIRSIQPAFVATQRLLHKEARSLPTWIVLTSQDYTTIGYKDTQGWAGVRVHPGHVGKASELVELLQLDRLYFCPAASGPQTAWVSGFEHDQASVGMDDWRLSISSSPFFLTPGFRVNNEALV